MAPLLSDPFRVSSGREFTAIPKALVDRGEQPPFDMPGEWFYAVSTHHDEYTHFRQSASGRVEECPAGLLHVRYASADGERVVTSKFEAVEAPTRTGTVVTFRCVLDDGAESFPAALAVDGTRLEPDYGTSDVERDVLREYHGVDVK